MLTVAFPLLLLTFETEVKPQDTTRWHQLPQLSTFHPREFLPSCWFFQVFCRPFANRENFTFTFPVLMPHFLLRNRIIHELKGDIWCLYVKILALRFIQFIALRKYPVIPTFKKYFIKSELIFVRFSSICINIFLLRPVALHNDQEGFFFIVSILEKFTLHWDCSGFSDLRGTSRAAPWAWRLSCGVVS